MAQALRDQQLTQADLAKKIGVNRSWATRFFRESDGMKTLDDDLRWKIEDFLGIKFFSAVENNPASALARKLDKVMEKDPRLSESIALLIASLEDDHYHEIPHLPTKDLVDFGKAIMRAAHADPDKPGKVGKIAITWLAERLQKLKP